MKSEVFTSGSDKQQCQYKGFQPTTIKHGWSWEIPALMSLMDEIVLDKESILPERRDDWHGVQNYVRGQK